MFKSEERQKLKEYFYGSAKPIFIASIGIISFFVPILGLLISIPLLVCALIVYLIEKYTINKEAESLYDYYLMNDLNCFSERALLKLGLRKEQVDIILPIKTIGPLDNYESYIKNYNFISSADKHGWIIAIIIWPFYILFKAYKILKSKNLHVPKLLFKMGSDEKVRYSLCQAHIFLFNEDQLYVYRVSYDFCTGEFFDETTFELFYRDIDCVKTGIDYRKLLYKKVLQEFSFEYFKVTSISNTSISAYVDSSESILDTQVKGMRTLIRNKKLEMDSLTSTLN